MKQSLCMAAATLGFLAGCASVETSMSGTPAQNAAPGSIYCWKGRLNSDGNGLVCNWANSANQACHETMSSRLDKASLASEPARAKRCDNGQWLVQVEKR